MNFEGENIRFSICRKVLVNGKCQNENCSFGEFCSEQEKGNLKKLKEQD